MMVMTAWTSLGIADRESKIESTRTILRTSVTTVVRNQNINVRRTGQIILLAKEFLQVEHGHASEVLLNYPSGRITLVKVSRWHGWSTHT